MSCVYIKLFPAQGMCGDRMCVNGITEPLGHNFKPQLQGGLFTDQVKRDRYCGAPGEPLSPDRERVFQIYLLPGNAVGLLLTSSI